MTSPENRFHLFTKHVYSHDSLITYISAHFLTLSQKRKHYTVQAWVFINLRIDSAIFFSYVTFLGKLFMYRDYNIIEINILIIGTLNVATRIFTCMRTTIQHPCPHILSCKHCLSFTIL